MKRLLLYALAVGVALLVLAVVAIVALVEDWSRDLSQNVARTSPEASDPRLRPLDLPLPPAEVTARLTAAVARLPGWSPPVAADEKGLSLSTVHTSRLLRFRDDVTVRLEPRDGGTRVHAESRSRIGRGDLGQNPRNLRELLEALRAECERDTAD